MEADQATRFDVTKLFERPAKRMKAEYRNAGLTVAEAKAYFVELLGKDQVIAFRVGGRALALFGWEERDGSAHTSFAAFEEYFSARHVRFLRHFLIEFQRKLGGTPIVSNSFSEHPRTEKWFKSLGFELVSTNGLHRTFVKRSK